MVISSFRGLELAVRGVIIPIQVERLDGEGNFRDDVSAKALVGGLGSEEGDLNPCATGEPADPGPARRSADPGLAADPGAAGYPGPS